MGTYAIIYIEYKKKDKWEWVRFTPNNQTEERSYLVKQGLIRDLVRDTYWEYYNRGLPNDISPELKEYIKNEDSYSWGKTYITLDDLNKYCDSSINHFKEQLRNNEINRKLDKLINKLDILLNNPSIDKKEQAFKEDSENLEDPEDLEITEEIQETIDDFRFIKSFSEGICILVDMYLNDIYIDDTDVRLIMYCE